MPTKMPRALQKRARDAEALIQYFEDQGRTVCGVSFKGTEIRIEFEKGEDPLANFNTADFTDMSK